MSQFGSDVPFSVFNKQVKKFTAKDEKKCEVIYQGCNWPLRSICQSCFWVLSTNHKLHWPAKKFPRKNSYCSVRFSPAEYEYQKYFFPITSRSSEILKQRSKNQENRLFIGCVYAKVNQQI